MRRLVVLIALLGCRGAQVVESSSDAAVDTMVVDTMVDDTMVDDTMVTTPDTPLSDGWPDGSAVTSPGCGTRPGPRMVRLAASSAFCIDATEVTNAQYDQFLGSAKPAAPGYCFTPEYGTSETALRGPNKPRTNVRWCAAFQYCAWAGKRLCGKIGGGRASFETYESASESQWSYACRQGAKNTNYPYGPEEDVTKCVLMGPIADVGSKKTCTGQSAPFNEIFDLSGNVGEWSDACDRYEGVTGVDERVCAVRGGWIDNDRQDCNQPQTSTVMYRSETLGFRCCVDL